MKIIRFGPSGKMVLIGEDKNHSTWYVIGDKVRTFLSKFKEGDDVSIRAEKGADGRSEVLVFIQPATAGEPSTGNGGGEPAEPQEPTSSAPASTGYKKPWTGKPWQGKSNYQAPAQKSYGKTPEEQETIKRQAIGHMTSRTMIGLAAHLTPENIHEVMESIYKKYVELVG